MQVRAPHQGRRPPHGAEGPAQYGPRVAAVIVYLCAGQLLSQERTVQALAKLFGILLSSGTVAASPAGGWAGSWSTPASRSPSIGPPRPAAARPRSTSCHFPSKGGSRLAGVALSYLLPAPRAIPPQ
jgi:hypothetical protein